MTRWHGRELPLEGCSDDTALPRHSGPGPVRWSVSGSTACHHCAPRWRRYNVVTTLAVSVPVIDANIRGFGLTNLLGRVRASGIPVLALDADPDAACAGILSEARRAVAEDRFDFVVPGCVGMVQVARISRGAARPGHRPGRRRLGGKAADRHPDRLIPGARQRAPYRENTAACGYAPKTGQKTTHTCFILHLHQSIFPLIRPVRSPGRLLLPRFNAPRAERATESRQHGSMSTLTNAHTLHPPVVKKRLRGEKPACLQTFEAGSRRRRSVLAAVCRRDLENPPFTINAQFANDWPPKAA